MEWIESNRIEITVLELIRDGLLLWLGCSCIYL